MPKLATGRRSVTYRGTLRAAAFSSVDTSRFRLSVVVLVDAMVSGKFERDGVSWVEVSVEFLVMFE